MSMPYYYSNREILHTSSSALANNLPDGLYIQAGRPGGLVATLENH